jgi:hypothetical protein
MATSRIDFFGTEPHFLSHLAPIWRALPPEHQGAFTCPTGLHRHARLCGIPNPVAVMGDGELLLTAAYGNFRRWARQRPTVLCEHGAGQSYGNTQPSYAGGAGDRDRAVAFLVANEQAADRNRVSHPHIPTFVVGCPKLDHWTGRAARPPADLPIVALGFHWDCRIVPETRTAFPYYEPILTDLAARYRLLGHGHPRIFRDLQSVYERAGIEPVRDFDEIQARADVYCCDNSSTLYEFAATTGPVVVLNAPWYRSCVRHGLRFWDEIPGPQVDQPADTYRAIDEALTGAWDTERAQVTARVFPHLGTASRTAADAVMRLVGSRLLAAA